ncbi:helix-turn-helix domain-containing protein [Hoeflea sp.]|uniref:helix-turn-helix domain-containing protein n=1 Tax=Hoeflea sp. TaxID=1940281 RepID=UPI003B51ACC1
MTKTTELQLEFRGQAKAAEVHTGFESDGLSVQYSRLMLPAEYEFRWDGDTHYLAHHDLVLLDGEMEVVGEKTVPGGDIRDLMTFVPAGQALEGWAKPANRLNAFTVVCFDPDAMEEELQREFNGFEARPQIYFKEEDLGATMRKLGRLMADQTAPVSKIYAETLGLSAALEMYRLSANMSGPVSDNGAGKLSNAQSRLVQSYIEDNLAKDLGLDELAGVCGLTRFHFSRAFKATFGAPPYQYVNQRRIEKAKQMLATTGIAVGDIADACGFNGASQFGRAFRSIVGQTPLAFRKTA